MVFNYPTVLSMGIAVILGAASPAPARASDPKFAQPNLWPQILTVDHASEHIGPGVTYDRWALRTVAGPISVHVTTVDLRNPLVMLSIATQGGRILGPGEPLSAMADRAHAEAAINGDYYDISESGSPLNVVVEGGRIEHQPDGAAALVIGANNVVTMGPVTFRATVSDASGARLDIGAVNDWTKGSVLSLLTPELGSANGDGATEIVLTPAADVSDSYRVSNAGHDLTALLALGNGELGIAARPPQAQSLQPFAIGDVVTLSFDGAPTPSSVVAAIGGGPMLLRGGEVASDPAAPAPQEANVRYPVSGAGISSDRSTLWLVTVDGRAPAKSIGITRPMLGALLASLGAADAMAFDSGGSAEMAVRHLGDFGVSVANTPSDGRERAIADALVVQNAATPGPVAHVILRADAPDVLVGSHEDLRVSAVDANDQPVAVAADDTAIAVDCACAAIRGQAVVGVATGIAHVVVRAAGLDAPPLTFLIVQAAAHVVVTGPAAGIDAGAKIHLSIAATSSDGMPITVDQAAVTWSASGDGVIAPDGTLTAGPAAGKTEVTAIAGGARASIEILVGEHALLLEGVPKPGAWRYAASPVGTAGAVDVLPSPDGVLALHLRYDFSAGGTSRAAYAQTNRPLEGEPLAMSVSVYGDGHGEWLRGAYRNDDGIVDGVTLARHVDWIGWKMLRVAIPPQVRWPIVWTRFYAVETARDARERGDLWFRDFSAIYDGPRQM